MTCVGRCWTRPTRYWQVLNKMDPTVTGTDLDETLIGRWCTRIRYWQVLTKMDPLLTGTEPDETHFGRCSTRIWYWQVLRKMDPIVTGTEPGETHISRCCTMMDPILVVAENRRIWHYIGSYRNQMDRWTSSFQNWNGEKKEENPCNTHTHITSEWKLMRKPACLILIVIGRRASC
jgi:hypothetical protein